MIQKLTENIYYMQRKDETDRPSLGLICGKKYSMIVDSGNSPNHAKEFISEVKSMNVPPLKYLVLTHHHWDHIFGIEEMNLITIANNQTEKEINEMKKLKWDDQSLLDYLVRGKFSDFTIKCIKEEIPNREDFSIGNLDIVYKDQIEIDLGDLKCMIKVIGGSHTDDSTIIYIPKEEVLFLGDCIYGRRYNGVYGYKKENLLPMIEEIEQYDAKHYIVSHMEIYNKSQIQKLWSELKLAETIVGNDYLTEEIIKRSLEKFNEDLSEDLKLYISYFADVNKALLDKGGKSGDR